MTFHDIIHQFLLNYVRTSILLGRNLPCASGSGVLPWQLLVLGPNDNDPTWSVHDLAVCGEDHEERTSVNRTLSPVGSLE